MTIKYPEHKKLSAVAYKSQTVGEFLDWLAHEKGATIAARHQHSKFCYVSDDGLLREYASCGYRENELMPMSSDTSRLLAEFFKIDEAKLETEKRSMLEETRRCESRKS